MAGKSIVVWGAGRIGRGFVADLFSTTGYDITLVDQSQELIAQLRDAGRFTVVHARNADERDDQVVSGYSALSTGQTDELANAMALPGGLIIVTQGLLDQVESENELAFVLGHELGHFKNRDHLRGLGRGAVLSLFFAVTLGGDAGGVGIKVADLTLRGFSRNQESDADAFGLSLVNAEYGHVDEAWRLFERWSIADDSIINFVSYLSTHPEAGDRVSELEAQARREGWLLEGNVTLLRW